MQQPSVTVSWVHGPNSGGDIPPTGSLTMAPIVTFNQLIELYRAAALAMGFAASTVDSFFDGDLARLPPETPAPGPYANQQNLIDLMRGARATDSEGGHAD